jgi:hypothetical protein
MQESDLTDDEIALVLQHREKIALAAAARVFKTKALKTALAYDHWSAESGEGLTFSTFVNTFGYQDVDGKTMYEAVSRIFEAALHPKD